MEPDRFEDPEAERPELEGREIEGEGRISEIERELSRGDAWEPELREEETRLCDLPVEAFGDRTEPDRTVPLDEPEPEDLPFEPSRLEG